MTILYARLVLGRVSELAVNGKCSFLEGGCSEQKLLRRVLVLLLWVALGLQPTACFSYERPTTDFSQAKWSDGSSLAPGQPVIVDGDGADRVGLWLMYSDQCETDITYNWVPAGAGGALAEQLCRVDGQWWVKLTFSPEQRRRYELVSDNTWLPLHKVTRGKP